MSRTVYKNSRTIAVIMALSISLVVSYRTFGTSLLKKSSSYKLFSSTLTSPSASVSVSHPAYVEVEKSFIEEYGIIAVLFKHKKSGAEVMSVTADDNNKVFGVTFRTPPSGVYATYKSFFLFNCHH